MSARSSHRSGQRWVVAALALLVLGGLVGVPALGVGPNLVRMLLVTLTWVVTSLAWNLLGGVTGQVSFGFAVFYGLGAYATALSINAGVHAYLALLAGGLAAAAGSVVVGLPTFRLRGPYFAIATIGVNEAVRIVMANLEATGGASGYRILEPGPFNQAEQYYAALGAALFAFLVSWAVMRSRFGLALRAIREDQDAAADLGDDASALVPGNGRQGARPAVVEGRKVRVAKPGTRDLDQHLAFARAL